MTNTLADLVDLTPEQLLALSALERDRDLRQTFYFTGGTLLKALGIVPRRSNDLDFFTFPEVNQRIYLKQRQSAVACLKSAFGDDAVHATDAGAVHRPSGMVIDLVADTIQNIDSFVTFGALQTAGIKDIAASKASALCSRDEIKDYIDIAFLSEKYGWLLKDLEELAEKKFGLGTITEEKLLSELLSKREQFTLSPDIFLREGEKNIARVQTQISALIEQTTL